MVRFLVLNFFLFAFSLLAFTPAHARFLQTDPVGYDAGNNFYVYVNNDPMNNLDPTGMVANVVVDGNDVKIELIIKYEGADALPEVTERFNTGIEEKWTGEVGEYNVTTTVRGPQPGDDPSNINVVTVKHDQGRAEVNQEGNRGKWDQQNTGEEAAHDSGHLMGLEDKYETYISLPSGDIKSRPQPGYENNIMADPKKDGIKPSQIRQIIRDKDNNVDCSNSDLCRR